MPWLKVPCFHLCSWPGTSPCFHTCSWPETSPCFHTCSWPETSPCFHTCSWSETRPCFHTCSWPGSGPSKIPNISRLPKLCTDPVHCATLSPWLLLPTKYAVTTSMVAAFRWAAKPLSTNESHHQNVILFGAGEIYLGSWEKIQKHPIPLSTV